MVSVMFLINLMVTTCYRLQKYINENLKRNKLTKWGFKLWVLADKTGYTYAEKVIDIILSESGFSHNVRSSIMLQYNRKSTTVITARGIII